MLTDLQKIANGGMTATFNEQKITFHSPTLSDLCEFEDAFGDLEAVFSVRSKVSKTKAMRFLLWRSMLHAEPELTLEEAGNRISFSDMAEDGPAIEVLNSLLPEASRPKAADPAQPGKRNGAR